MKHTRLKFAALLPVLMAVALIFSGLITGDTAMAASKSRKPAAAKPADSRSLERQAFESANVRLLKARGLDYKKNRKLWIDIARAFEAAQRKYPSSAYAPDALYNSGVINLNIYLLTGDFTDKKRTLDAFYRLKTGYKTSRHVPDAEFYIAETFRVSKEYDKASYTYRRYIDKYPQHTHRSEADARLADIDKSRNNSKLAQSKSGDTPKKNRPPSAKAAIPVNAVRSYATAGYTRVVLDLGAKTEASLNVFHSPDRIEIDLPSAQIATGVESITTLKNPPGTDIASAVKLAPSDSGGVDVTISASPAGKGIRTAQMFQLSNPPRLVVDIWPGTAPGKNAPAATTDSASHKPGSTAEPAPEPAEEEEGVTKDDSVFDSIESFLARAPSTPAGKMGDESGDNPAASSLRPQTGAIRKIVIDPGHGGKDPGAIGPRGLKEKNVVLDVALELKLILERELGAKVYLTRTKDVFIPLEERTAMANDLGADLFVSIHANASRNRSARGIETYFLSPARSKHELEIAARENAVSDPEMRKFDSDLAFILSDMENTSKVNESSFLASEVQRYLVGGMQRGYGGVKNLGVKQSMFFVLYGATMPSILIETGFISNYDEEKRLRTESYRTKIARSIADGIKQYAAQSQIALH